jgi:GTP-binding protein HflX
VNKVLSEVGAGDLPQIEVFNKVDLLQEQPHVERGEEGRARRVWMSAQSGAGVDLLIDAIADFLGPELVHRHIVLKPHEGRARARFFEAGAVIAEQVLPSGDTDLEVSMPRRAFERLCRAEGLHALLAEEAKACAASEPFLESHVPARWAG